MERFLVTTLQAALSCRDRLDQSGILRPRVVHRPIDLKVVVKITVAWVPSMENATDID
jgi:hypothetical protein